MGFQQVALLFLILFLWAVPSNAACVKRIGYAFRPLDLNGSERTVNSSPEECRDRCLRTEGCVGSSNWTGGGCHLIGTGAVLFVGTNVVSYDCRSTLPNYSKYRIDVTKNVAAPYWCIDELKFYDENGNRIATPASGASAETHSASSAYDAKKAFNEVSNNNHNYYCSKHGFKTGWLQFDFGMKTKISKYEMERFFKNGHGNQYSPVDWKFEGSNDGQTWITLDAQSGYNTWTDGEIKSFGLYFVVPFWLHRGKGRCPGAKNFGHESTEHSTLEQCRIKCEEYHEAYFSLWTEGSTTKCGCYTDCDELDTNVDADSWEILSVTVRTELENKNNEIKGVEYQNTELGGQVNDLTQNLNTCSSEKATCTVNLQSKASELSEMTSDRNTCNSEKATCTVNLQSKTNELSEMTSDRELWKSRFQEVQRLDNAIVYHADMAMNKFPDQAAVGNAMKECNRGSIPSFMDRLVFLGIGAGIGAGLYAILNKSQKNRGDEYTSILEI